MGNEPQRTLNIRYFAKPLIAVLLLIAVAFAQAGYDNYKPKKLPGTLDVSPVIVKFFDLGFDPTAASFYWINTMPKIIKMLNGDFSYAKDVKTVIEIDPKLSFPYVYSVLTLPAFPQYADGTAMAIEIGERGLKEADTDWRIPFYLATTYFLELKDSETALLYFDIAARTPGIPTSTKRYALNFGISSNLREQTEDLWRAIFESTKDDFTKERAKAYIERPLHQNQPRLEL